MIIDAGMRTLRCTVICILIHVMLASGVTLYAQASSPSSATTGTTATTGVAAPVSATGSKAEKTPEEKAREAEEAARKETQKRTDTILYGMESQVLELLDTLKTEKNTKHLDELAKAWDASTSAKLRAGIFDLYSSLESAVLAGRAAQIIKGRDDQADVLVGAAFTYLLDVKADNALEESREILEERETRYLLAAVRTMGQFGGEPEAAQLIKAWEDDELEPPVKEAIVRALGTLKRTESRELLEDLAKSETESKIIRMNACDALGKLSDDRAIPTLIQVSTGSDPNVRAAAIEALGQYTTSRARAAVREGLRDSHVLVRSAAIRAVEKSEDSEAIPFLRYKVVYDPEKTVRDASIRVLARIGTKKDAEFLLEFALDKKNGISFRGQAFAAILEHGDPSLHGSLLSAFNEAQKEKDRAVFTTLVRAVSAVDKKSVEPFIRALLTDTDFSMRMGAIVWIDRNKASSFGPELQKLVDNDTNEAVRKRAALALGRF